MIDIIVPCYNSSNYIIRTLNSIKNQSFDKFCCLIIDDNSTDNTVDVIQQFITTDSRFKLLIKLKKLEKGAGSSRQYGFDNSKNEFVYWFDADDIMLKDNLKSKIEYLNQHENIDYVISPQQRVNSDLKDFGSINHTKFDNLINDYFTGRCAFYIQSTLWKRNSVYESGLTWKNGSIDDWDFNMQAIYAKLKLHILNEVQVWYVYQDNSVMRKHQQFSFWEINSEIKLRNYWYRKLKIELDDISKDFYTNRLKKILFKSKHLTNKFLALKFLITK